MGWEAGLDQEGEGLVQAMVCMRVVSSKHVSRCVPCQQAELPSPKRSDVRSILLRFLQL